MPKQPKQQNTTPAKSKKVAAHVTKVKKQVSKKIAIVKNLKNLAAGKPPPKLVRQAVATASPRLQRAVNLRPQPPRYFVAPVWGLPVASAGGTSMQVTLGPIACRATNYGSKPAQNTPSVMPHLLGGPHVAFGWIAGHLLNDNMGGPGLAKNLTPLTTAGNKNHLNGCEAKIKNFLVQADSRLEFHSGDSHFFGVHYRVEVSDDKWDDNDPHLKFVATELRVWAHVMKMDKLTGAVSAAVQTDCPTFWFDPLVDLVIDNTGHV